MNSIFRLRIWAMIFFHCMCWSANCQSSQKTSTREKLFFTSYTNNPQNVAVDSVVFCRHTISSVLLKSDAYKALLHLIEKSSANIFRIEGETVGKDVRISIVNTDIDHFLTNPLWKWNSGAFTINHGKRTILFFILPSKDKAVRDALLSLFPKTAQQIDVVHDVKYLANYYLFTGGPIAQLVLLVQKNQITIERSFIRD